MLRSTSVAGRCQSIRASALSILAAWVTPISVWGRGANVSSRASASVTSRAPISESRSCRLPAVIGAGVTFALRAGSLAFGWRLPVYRPRPPRG